MSASKIRPSAVADMFYPGNPDTLRESVSQFLADARKDTSRQPLTPRAIIAPHAGYIYSGPVAAYAYSYLENIKDRIATVVLIGPSHRVPLLGFATSGADYFATPLGNIPVNRNMIERINALPFVHELDQAHAMEHSLEVHLPFLQVTLGDFDLVPIVAGDASPEDTSELISLACDREDTLLVVSSDLSHYHDYETAKRMDHDTCEAIEALDIKRLDSQHACGYIPVRGLLAYARQHHLHAKTVDCRNSGDTAGPRDQVVGYGSYVFV
ncbi:MAG: AmmeMemoRadiSam system protein B [Gammaproteobacteria bacterium]|jgi:AmmeMemoRadiSam system protein B